MLQYNWLDDRLLFV